MHPMYFMSIVTFVCIIPIVALFGFLIAVASHKNKVKWTFVGALVGLILAIVIVIYFWKICAFCL
jgi:hypothetical protein